MLQGPLPIGDPVDTGQRQENELAQSIPAPARPGMVEVADQTCPDCSQAGDIEIVECLPVDMH
jgi:hypothetical protein